MKRILLFVFVTIFYFVCHAQIGGYTFSQTATGVYTPVSGTVILSNCLNTQVAIDTSAVVSLPQPFIFEGVAYSSIRVGANGWITMGSNNPLLVNSSFSYFPFSSLYNVPGVIAPFTSGDLSMIGGSPCSSNVQVLASGNEFIVQWNDLYRAQLGGGVTGIKFQVRLNFTDNSIKAAYGGISGGAYVVTVKTGLRGNGIDFFRDVNNRRVTNSSNWPVSERGFTAEDGMDILNGPPAGLVYTWLPGNCFAPTNLKAIEATSSSVKIKWNKPAAADGYEYSLANLPVSGTAITDTFVNLTGLTASTIYNISVRGRCGSSYTPWATLKFRTVCGTAALPYTYKFPTADVRNVQGAHTYFPCIAVEKDNLNSSFLTLQWQHQGDPEGIGLQDLNNNGTATNSWFFTPRFPMNAGTTYRIYFKYKGYGNNVTQNNHLKIQMATYPDVESLLPAPLINMPLLPSNLFTVKDSFTLFTPAISGLYCAGFNCSSSVAFGAVTIPEVDVLDNSSVAGLPCPALLAPANNATLPLYTGNLFTWRKVPGAQSYKFYITETVLGISNLVLAETTDTSFISPIPIPGDQVDWWVVPRVYGSDAAGCQLQSRRYFLENPPAPANDLCAAAIPLTVSNGFCRQPLQGSLINAGFSNNSDTSGGCIPNHSNVNDVWYKIAMPATGNAVVQLSYFNQYCSGNFAVTAFSGACGSLSRLGCSYLGKESLPNLYTPYHCRVAITGRTAGENILLRVSNGSNAISFDQSYFTICAYDTSNAVLPAIAVNGNACTSIQPTVIDSLTGNLFMWVPLLAADGKLIAQVHPNGRRMGTVNGGVYLNAGPLRIANSIPYFDRNLTLTPSALETSLPATNIGLRMYAKQAEVNTYNIANGNTPLSFFKIYKNTDNCAAAFSNPGQLIGFLLDSGRYNGNDYYLATQTNSFSSFYFYKSLNSVTLPVKLTDFYAKASGGNGLLYWTSEAEINFDYYEIERSRDANYFAAVGKVFGSGGGAYRFTDYNLQPGKWYYRLKLTDKDGRFTQSDIAAINIGKEPDISIAPNPVRNRFVIRTASIFTGWKVIDLPGRVLLQGNNIAGNNILQIDVSRLNAGQYFIQLTGEGQTVSRPFIKE